MSATSIRNLNGESSREVKLMIDCMHKINLEFLRHFVLVANLSTYVISRDAERIHDKYLNLIGLHEFLQSQTCSILVCPDVFR